MKLLRVGPPGGERAAVLDTSGKVRDLGDIQIDGEFFASGGVGRVADGLRHDDLAVLDTEGMRTGPPLARPGKIVCIGLNYRDHAAETGASLPDEPVVFMKAPNAMVGPEDEVLIPRNSVKTDWEVELAVVIGRKARYLNSHDEAREVIGGYAISNDVSERELQLERGGQWDKGKSCETFNPFGPWLVMADEIPDPQALGLRLWVNDELRQDSTTKNMIFEVSELIRYLSWLMVLEPGDVINTGTPAGVALGMPTQPYLRPGDVMKLEIDGLGRQHSVVRQA